jgi:hypothetical protein
MIDIQNCLNVTIENRTSLATRLKIGSWWYKELVVNELLNTARIRLCDSPINARPAHIEQMTSRTGG